MNKINYCSLWEFEDKNAKVEIVEINGEKYTKIPKIILIEDKSVHPAFYDCNEIFIGEEKEFEGVSKIPKGHKIVTWYGMLAKNIADYLSALKS